MEIANMGFPQGNPYQPYWLNPEARAGQEANYYAFLSSIAKSVSLVRTDIKRYLKDSASICWPSIGITK